MLQELETQVITETPTLTVSPAAAQAVNEILAERKMDGYALRVFVAGSGCCGVQFGMALDDKVHANDTTLEAGGLKLVVDSVSMEYVRGATINFVNDADRGAGFVVDSPYTQSHSHSHEDGEGCACGGSCSCNN
jgi:iron-sulfur cluster assembly accessory protein